MDAIKRIRNGVYMKVTEILKQDKPTISFEVFPPKKDTDFADVEAAATSIAELNPSYMSVTYGAGGSTKGLTIKLAEGIQNKYNVPTIAHLTCVCADKAGISQALSRKDFTRMRCMSEECPPLFRRMCSMKCTAPCRDWSM